MNACKALLAAALVVTPLCAFGQASTWKIETPHSEAEFSIRHLGVTNVRGRIRGVTGQVTWDAANPANSHVEATMDATSVDTGEAKRDAKSRVTPSSTSRNIRSSPSTRRLSSAPAKDSCRLSATLTLAGVTKSVTLAVEGPAAPQPRGDGKTVSGFSATGHHQPPELQLRPERPTLKPPIIGDEVKFTIDLEVSK